MRFSNTLNLELPSKSSVNRYIDEFHKLSKEDVRNGKLIQIPDDSTADVVKTTICKRDQSYNSNSSLHAQIRSQKQMLWCDDDHEIDL